MRIVHLEIMKTLYVLEQTRKYKVDEFNEDSKKQKHDNQQFYAVVNIYNHSKNRVKQVTAGGSIKVSCTNNVARIFRVRDSLFN